MFQRAAQYLGYVAVRWLICLAQATPPSWAPALASWGGFVFHRLLNIRRRPTDENLRHAFPHLTDAERSRLIRAMWEHLILFGIEIAHSYRKVRPETYRRYYRLVGEREIVDLLLGDRPLVLVTAHFGIFELATYLIALFGHPVHSVARPLDNPYLDRFVNSFRGSQGQTILSKQGDYEKIQGILASGGTVSFVADQYAGSKGCWIEFFNRPASAHKAIALFSLANDAPLVVGSCRRIGAAMQFEMKFEAGYDPRQWLDVPGAVPKLTQAYTRDFERMILQAPEQYWWLHRRWKDHRKKKGSLSIPMEKPAARAA